MMKKNLSFLVAFAVALTMNTAVFADAANSNASNNIDVINTNNDTVNITLENALNNVENRNTELKLMNDKINSLYKQYDIDHNAATSLNVDEKNDKVNAIYAKYGMIDKLNGGSKYSNLIEINAYLGIKQLQDVKPLYDVQQIKDAKNDREDRLNVIKFDLQRQYMNVLDSRDQIDNINKTLTNIDEKIGQLQEKIKVGQASSNQLDTLNVQKAQLEAQKNDVQDSIDQSLLKIKQYLNIDLNKNLNLTSAKKSFAAFDDKDISKKIDDAVKKDYALSKINGNMDVLKKQSEIYAKYSHNYLSEPNAVTDAIMKQNGTKLSYVSEETNVKSQIVELQNKSIEVNAGLPKALWGNYYALKNKESAVQTQILTEKSVQDNYDKLKKNFEAGMTDKVTLDSAALELDKQKNLTERAINEYMVAQEELNYMLQGHASGYPNMSKQSMGTPGIGY